jgi:hypothetical protein
LTNTPAILIMAAGTADDNAKCRMQNATMSWIIGAVWQGDKETR